MHPVIESNRDAIADLCRRHGVVRLDAFGSAARGEDFDPARSDVDVLVEFAPDAPLTAILDLSEDLTALLDRPVDVVERQAVTISRNPIRRGVILGEAQPVYPG